MTMGPDPMTMTVRRSPRFGTRSPPSHRGELAEDVRVVPGARVRLGVVLHGEDGELLVNHPLDRVVVQVPVGDLELGRLHGLRVDREAVVLRGDVDPPGAEVLDGLVPAAVPELQLVRLAAEREAEDLVAE